MLGLSQAGGADGWGPSLRSEGDAEDEQSGVQAEVDSEQAGRAREWQRRPPWEGHAKDERPARPPPGDSESPGRRAWPASALAPSRAPQSGGGEAVPGTGQHRRSEVTSEVAITSSKASVCKSPSDPPPTPVLQRTLGDSPNQAAARGLRGEAPGGGRACHAQVHANRGEATKAPKTCTSVPAAPSAAPRAGDNPDARNLGGNTEACSDAGRLIPAKVENWHRQHGWASRTRSRGGGAGQIRGARPACAVWTAATGRREEPGGLGVKPGVARETKLGGLVRCWQLLLLVHFVRIRETLHLHFM